MLTIFYGSLRFITTQLSMMLSLACGIVDYPMFNHILECQSISCERTSTAEVQYCRQKLFFNCLLWCNCHGRGPRHVKTMKRHISFVVGMQRFLATKTSIEWMKICRASWMKLIFSFGHNVMAIYFRIKDINFSLMNRCDIAQCVE